MLAIVRSKKVAQQWLCAKNLLTYVYLAIFLNYCSNRSGEEQEEAAIQRLSDAGTVMKAQRPLNAASKRQSERIKVGDSWIKESGSAVAPRQKSAHTRVPCHISKLLLQSLCRQEHEGRTSMDRWMLNGNESMHLPLLYLPRSFIR